MKRAYTGILKVAFCLTLLSSWLALYAACSGEDSFKSQSLSQGFCNSERGDGRCDTDGDCCPGRRCSAFGMCEDC